MAVTYKKDRALFRDIVGVEEAETLLEWLQKYPKGKLDLSACTHLHPANMQVMLATKRTIQVRPTDSTLASWLDSAFKIQ